MSQISFLSLPLPASLLDNLQSMSFTEMTPIQAKSLPLILAGHDVIAKAKTGSGKTAAFGLGILSKLNVEQYHVQALVVCPTRELAEQVTKAIRRLARLINNIKVLTLSGGLPMAPQSDSLAHGAHIIVGTPGRILDHLQHQRLDLSQITTLVFDEADRLLDMGFEDEISQILRQVPTSRQTLLFSATYPDGILAMSQRVQAQPLSISVDETHTNASIAQRFYEVIESQRNQTLAKILSLFPQTSTVVFCNTRAACQEVEIYLNQLGFSAIALHGDLEQRERTQVLLQFANQSCSILVATDVAARGLDIQAIGLVVNYQITHDPEVHIHRVGRTGRAGAEGLAITLVAANEMYHAHRVEDYQGSKMVWHQLDTLSIDLNSLLTPQMQTLCLGIGRKNKIRPGDILGALTKDAGLDGQNIGKIDIAELDSYVAVNRQVMKQALRYFQQGKIKGKTVRARKL